MATSPHVGTMREKSLHADLKRWYFEPGDRVEAAVDRFVVDLVRGELLIEVQTRGFSAMRRKLAVLIGDGRRVRIIHPIAAERHIVKIDADGDVISRRRSPKRGRPADLFAELTSFPWLVGSGLEIDVVLIREEEVRRFDPERNRRRRGWLLVERRLLDVVDVVSVREAADLPGLLTGDLPERFTTADLATAVGRPRRLGQQIAYCLRHAGVIEATGRRGNAVEYRFADTSSGRQA